MKSYKRKCKKNLVLTAFAALCCCGLSCASEQTVFAGGTESSFSTDQGETLTYNISSAYPNILAVVVLTNNTILYEHYFNGTSDTTKYAMFSAVKTITSAAVGTLIDSSKITSIHDPLPKYLGKYISKGTHFDNITVGNVLSMQDGLNHTESESMLVTLEDPCAMYFSLTKYTDPGTHFKYSSFNSQVLSALITAVTGLTEEAYVAETIFKPLGITDWTWSSDQAGVTNGGWGLSLTARDMAKFGALLLGRGKYYGTQVFSESWFTDMTTVKSSGGRPHGEQYGYHCWITSIDGHNAFFAGGYGGQFIYIIPDLNTAVVIASRTDRHREEHRQIINRWIVQML